MAPPHDLVKSRVLELLERQRRLLEGGKESDQFLKERPQNVIELAQLLLHLQERTVATLLWPSVGMKPNTWKK
jgi:hypothetical protein